MSFIRSWWLLFVFLCVQIREWIQMLQNYIWHSTYCLLLGQNMQQNVSRNYFGWMPIRLISWFSHFLTKCVLFLAYHSIWLNTIRYKNILSEGVDKITMLLHNTVMQKQLYFFWCCQGLIKIREIIQKFQIISLQNLCDSVIVTKKVVVTKKV